MPRAALLALCLASASALTTSSHRQLQHSRVVRRATVTMYSATASIVPSWLAASLCLCAHVSSNERWSALSRRENFGLDFAEDQAKNTPKEILGERRLKTEFIKSYKPTATVLEGKPYPLLQEVQQKKLLSKTSEAGLLGALDDLGLSLSDIEKLLPYIEKSGLLSIAAKNLPLAVILIGYTLVEPAPFLIPLLGVALKVPPPIYAAAALSTASAEAVIVLAKLDDYALLGLVLVPVALVSAVLAVSGFVG